MPDKIYYACFLKKFNNYFNRIIKGFATYIEYTNAAEDYFLYSKSINYSPNDNVSTELIMNDCPFDPDYVLILDNELNIVARWFILESVFTREKQRKFSLRRDLIYDFKDKLLNSPVYVQKGMLSDGDPFIFNSEGMSLNEVKKSETLLKDKSGIAWIVGYIANNTAATSISVPSNEKIANAYITAEDLASELGIELNELSSLFNIGSQRVTPAYFTKEVELRFGVSDNSPIPFINRVRMFFQPNFSSMNVYNLDAAASWNKTLFKQKNVGLDDLGRILVPTLRDQIVANKTNIYNEMGTLLNRPYLTLGQLSVLQGIAASGKPLLYNGTYYGIEVNVTSDTTEIIGPSNYQSFSGFATAINSTASLISERYTLHNDGEISVRPTSTVAYINIIENSPTVKAPTYTTTISGSRNKVVNATYDMFAIPYGRIYVRGSGLYFYTNEKAALAVATGIAKQLDASLYDLQLLPYCPIQDIIQDGEINPSASSLQENYDYNLIVGNNTTVDYTDSGDVYKIGPGTDYTNLVGGFIQNGQLPASAADIVSIDYQISGLSSSNIHNITGPTYDPATHTVTLTFETDADMDEYGVTVTFTVKYTGTANVSMILWATNNSFRVFMDQYKLEGDPNIKIESECNRYRFVSPNYQGAFDFNLAKNGNVADYIQAECTYKPYTPYIKVAPQFNNLYGTNYGDARGLICGGDFSLPRVNSAWESYELNNKNYQNIFNRDIQNLNFEQSLQMRQQMITGALGIFTGGVAGGAMGAKLGGGYGAIAGAAIGIGGGGAGFALDTDMLAKQQREAKQYSIDKFNYQLGNIKALPYTLTKVGAFDINSKIFPFLEFYTCTDEEKEALERKIEYESMTVMRIDLFGTYFEAYDQPRYFKGELIRNEEIAEDNHIFEAIYAELLKGVYI